MMYGFSAACVLGPIAVTTGSGRMRVLGPCLLILQFAWLSHAAWSRSPTVTLLPSAAHRQAHDELLAFVKQQNGPVWIPAHGGINDQAGKGTGAHGQAIFDLLQLLPKLPDGMLDLAAITDTARLNSLSSRAQQALADFFSRTNEALQERHFAAIVVDLFGSPPVDAWGALFGVQALGGDAPPYVRRSEPLLRQPTALRPLLGYEVHSPYVLLPR
jgi:hypothetical protein